MRNQNSKIKSFKTKDFEVTNVQKRLLLLLFVTIDIIICHRISAFESIIVDPVFAQIKGGLSASSVSLNHTIGERTGNTTGDLLTGGTSAASVTDGLAMTMSSPGRTGNTTNLTSTEGGLSALSVNDSGQE